MDLFLNQELHFEKLGHETLVSEDPHDWPKQIMDELYRRVPYTSDYSPTVVLDTVDPDRRYAMGRVELVNRLAINPRDDLTPSSFRGRTKALIPIIIRDGKMQPLDVLFCDGEAQPLTEERLRETLFHPAIFDSIRQRPGDMSLVEQLYPPSRQYGGARGPIIADVGSAGGLEKTNAAKPEFLLDAILPTIKKAHVEDIKNMLQVDNSFKAAVMANDSMMPFIRKIANVEVRKEQSYLRKVAESIIPTIIQVRKIHNGFLVKTANPNILAPTEDVLSRPEAVNILGADLVSRVESDGTTTVTSMPVQKDTLSDIDIKTIDSFGLYKVKTRDMRELVGWVFPKITDFSGTVLPLSIFSNGSESAIQEKISGIPIARQSDIINITPLGQGSFYLKSSSGAIALTPVKVTGEIHTPEGSAFMAETVLGEPIQITKVPGLKTVTELGEGHYGIPDECGFIPIERTVFLTENPDEYIKQAEAKALPNAVRVLTDGSSYSFQGAPVDKLAGVMNTQFLPLDEAVFLGSIFGQDPQKIKTAFSTMRGKGHTDLWFSAKSVNTIREKYASATKKAEVVLEKFPDLRGILFKEAAVLDDPTSVDKILSVGFINPENIMTFIEYIPEIESCIRKLSELLIASRLGLSSIDQGAVKKSLVHLDKVVVGLKTLVSSPQV